MNCPSAPALIIRWSSACIITLGYLLSSFCYAEITPAFDTTRRKKSSSGEVSGSGSLGMEASILSSGDKLKGKTMVLSYTTGAPADCMNWDDFFHFLRAACQFTGMNYGGTVHTGSVSYNLRQDPQQLADITQRATAHAEKLIALLQA